MGPARPAGVGYQRFDGAVRDYLVGEVAVEQGGFGPVHQLRQRDVVVQESGKLLRGQMARDLHSAGWG